jgi:glutamate racemase
MPSLQDPFRAPVGIFDSGVGGLSVLREMRRILPGVPTLFLGDQGHVPYGPRPLQEVRGFARGITRLLLEHGARLIVVACNAASAAALKPLRAAFPDVPFVGMEPAVKPAAEQTRSGKVGVLATPATFQGELYASVVERFAGSVTLFTDTCPGLVSQIEQGDLRGPATRAILERALQPMLAAGIDTVVLGCTHYPFVIPLVREIAGPSVRVIDPSPAVAQQARRVLELKAPEVLAEAERIGPGPVRFLTSGDPRALARLLPALLGGPGEVATAHWNAQGELELAGPFLG